MKTKKIIVEILVSDGPDENLGLLEFVSNEIVAGITTTVNSIVGRNNNNNGFLSTKKTSIVADVSINVLKTEK